MASASRSAEPRRMTVAEYLAGPVDKANAALIHGELVVSPRPAEERQDLAHVLGELLRRWTRHHDLGKMSYDIDLVLDEVEDVVYAPDLLFLTQAHQSRRRQGRIYGPADLCVEFISPHEKPRVQRAKYRDYAQYGVTWYWIINALGAKPLLEENELVEGQYRVRAEVVGAAWFEPVMFPGLQFCLPPLLAGDLKKAVKGKAKKLV